MGFISKNKISEEPINSFYKKKTLDFARRLEEDNYPKSFDGLKDWNLIWALTIKRPELSSNYIHLLDQEPFDEN